MRLHRRTAEARAAFERGLLGLDWLTQMVKS
jgi:hypothetical protein